MKSKFIYFIFVLLISCSLRNNKISYDGKFILWTDDFSEIELVMSYVLDDTDYRNLRKLEGIEKNKFIDNYWTEIDPDKGTSENELLDELKNRVLESKELFSGIDGGLLSDRAQIYIIYGPPDDEYKTSTYSNNNIEILIWKYNTGYEFNFIIDSFGRYKIINN
jgi:GWxTD domain-containing protein